MNHIKYFKDLFESISAHRKIALIILLIENKFDILHQCEILKNEINRLCLELRNFFLSSKHLMEQNE